MHIDTLADIFVIDIKRQKINIIGFFSFFGTHTRTYMHIYIYGYFLRFYTYALFTCCFSRCSACSSFCSKTNAELICNTKLKNEIRIEEKPYQYYSRKILRSVLISMHVDAKR